MKLFNRLKKNLMFLLAPVSFLMLASCGSYQYSGYESDGIYGDANRNYEKQNQNANQDSNSSYYKNLFAEEAALYGEVLSESTIFTDVDSYSSTGDYQPGSQQQATNYSGGQAPWGHNPDSYTVNIYNNGYYGGFYHPYWGGGLAFDPFWGPGYYGPGYWPGYWGPSFYGPRYWGNSWRIGFGGFHYGNHYGYGYGYPYAYGGGWNNPYHYNGYNKYGDNVSYNSGRRNASTTYNRSSSNTVRNATILDSRGRTSSYSRSIRNLRNSNDDYGVTRRTVAREYQPRSNSNYNSGRTSSTRNVYSRSSNDNGTYTRRQTSSPNQAVRSSNSSVRSSAPVRSSSSGRSSSGTSSSRGRGNN